MSSTLNVPVPPASNTTVVVPSVTAKLSVVPTPVPPSIVPLIVPPTSKKK